MIDSIDGIDAIIDGENHIELLKNLSNYKGKYVPWIYYSDTVDYLESIFPNTINSLPHSVENQNFYNSKEALCHDL